MNKKCDKIKSSYLGKEFYNKYGDKAKVVEYNSLKDITIEFDDGCIMKSTVDKIDRMSFIQQKNSYNTTRIGQSNTSNRGELAVIIEYINSQNVIIKYENGCIQKIQYKAFLDGYFKSQLLKTHCGVGYMGIGDFNYLHPSYQYWVGMISRCYSKSNKAVAYSDVIVCDEWHNFQNFAQWFESNYYEVPNSKMQLDKDFIKKGNKTYSKENCVFVPSEINNLLTTGRFHRGNTPIGVKKVGDNKYISACRSNGVKKYGKTASSEEESFSDYKKMKEDAIKLKANELIDIIPKILYDAMCSYKVEITD